jgi:hypothetical protein
MVLALTAATAVLGAGAAEAAETITYTYDARGRLVQVARSGGLNGYIRTVYQLDKADNRTSKTVTNTPP